jgi:hypothetical protein
MLLDVNRRELATEWCLKVCGITENPSATLSDRNVVFAASFETPQRRIRKGDQFLLFTVLLSALGLVGLVDDARFDEQPRWNADRGTRDKVFEPFDKDGLAKDRDIGPASHEYVIINSLFRSMTESCKRLYKESQTS